MFPNEILISDPAQEDLVLTSYRIFSKQVALFGVDLRSIFLEDIDAIVIRKKTNYGTYAGFSIVGGMLGITVASLGASLNSGVMAVAGLLLLPAAVIIGKWMGTHKIVVITGKAGELIRLSAAKTPERQIQAFIASIERAKERRLEALGHRRQ